MTTTDNVFHALIRDSDGMLRCMDAGCAFNNRRPGPEGTRDMTHHRASDILPAAFSRAARVGGPDRRRGGKTG